MKNQYFGDIKDLFKYDLAKVILRGIPSLKRITFITMLTENDERSDGNKLHYQGKAGCNNLRLVSYLGESVVHGRRNVSEIKDYFEYQDMEIYIYGERDFYFYSPGNIDDVLDGTATFTWGRELDALPAGSADMALVTIPSNGLKPLPEYERICAAWLSSVEELDALLESSDLKSYFRGVATAVKPGGRIYMIVEETPGAFRLYTEAELVLRDMGFDYERTLPETDIQSFRERMRFPGGGPQVIVYAK